MAYLLLLLIRTSVYIDVFTGCMPPKTAWDRAQRSESELNSILQSRVLKERKRTKRSIRAPDISQLSKRTPKDGARTERTWHLIWKAADRYLLKVGHSSLGMLLLVVRTRSPFRCKSFPVLSYLTYDCSCFFSLVCPETLGFSCNQNELRN